MTTITITKDVVGEYRVPAPGGGEAGAYYTDAKDDAVGTALLMHGAEIKIRFKRVEEHPET